MNGQDLLAHTESCEVCEGLSPAEQMDHFTDSYADRIDREYEMWKDRGL